MVSGSDVSLDPIALTARPVLVVTDAQQQSGAVGDLGVQVQICVGADVDLVAVALRPGEERGLVVRPSRAAGPLGEPVEDEVADVARLGRVGRMGHGDPTTRTGRLLEQTGGERAFERRVGRAGVEVRAAEVVVRTPGVGRQGHQDPTRRAGRGSDDEERGRAQRPPLPVDRVELDLVEARGPVGPGDELGGGRPAATGGHDVDGEWMVIDGDTFDAFDDGARSAHARHGDVDRGRVARRGVESYRRSGDDRLGHAIGVQPRGHHRPPSWSARRVPLTPAAVEPSGPSRPAAYAVR